MKYFMLLVLLICFCASCGGGNDVAFDPSIADCSFNVADFENGPDADNINGHWRCAAQTGSYNMSFYADGTGSSSALGSFTWEQVSCDEIVLVTSQGDVTITEMSGSVDSANASFHQTFDETGRELDNSCYFVPKTPLITSDVND